MPCFLLHSVSESFYSRARMPLDTFICGTCRNTFTDLNEFVIHKQSNCSSGGGSHSGLGPGTEVLQLHVNKSGIITGLTAESLGAGKVEEIYC